MPPSPYRDTPSGASDAYASAWAKLRRQRNAASLLSVAAISSVLGWPILGLHSAPWLFAPIAALLGLSHASRAKLRRFACPRCSEDYFDDGAGLGAKLDVLFRSQCRACALMEGAPTPAVRRLDDAMSLR